MAASSDIEWTDATWNPVVGCSVVSPGCQHCYAMKLAGGRLRNHPSRAGLTQPSKAGPVWTGKVRLWEPWLTQPFEWKTPRRIFVCAHGDLFHEDVPDEWIDKVFAVMALTPQHTYQVLTKRAARMRKYFEERWQGTPARDIKMPDGHVLHVPSGGETGRRHQVEQALREIAEKRGMIDPDIDDQWDEKGRLKIARFVWPLPNVWLGVSAEDQARADERIPHLLATPAAVRFVSLEPLLGPIDLYNGDPDPRLGGHVATATYIGEWWEPGDARNSPPRVGVDWVIVGGESGTGARPMHPDWVRSLRDQCLAADRPMFFKQWGEWEPREEWSGHLGNGRFETMLAIMSDGRQCPDDAVPQDVGAHRMARVGKKHAGALLDGKLHREFPWSAT